LIEASCVRADVLHDEEVPHHIDNALSPGMLRDPNIHAARSRRLSAVARCTLRSRYA
jgi:hypothetical protein